MMEGCEAVGGGEAVEKQWRSNCEAMGVRGREAIVKQLISDWEAMGAEC